MYNPVREEVIVNNGTGVEEYYIEGRLVRRVNMQTGVTEDITCPEDRVYIRPCMSYKELLKGYSDLHKLCTDNLRKEDTKDGDAK